jgi:hypothetical protein
LGKVAEKMVERENILHPGGFLILGEKLEA